MHTTHTRPLVRALTVAVVLLTVVASGAAVAQSVPDLPANFYGEVTIDGEPAPAGTVIEAEIDGTRKGSYELETAGSYGGPRAEDGKLNVQPGSEGDAVRFFLRGDFGRVPADTVAPAAGGTPVTWSEGTIEEVDLSLDTSSSSADVSGGSATVAVASPDIDTVEIDLPAGTNVQSIEIVPSDAPTGGAPVPGDAATVATYLDIEPIVPDGPNSVDGEVTVSAAIPASTLEAAGIAPAEAALAHYLDGSWATLATTTSGSDPVTLTATTDGLSPFAVIEPAAPDTGGAGGGGGGGGGSSATTETPTPTPTATPTVEPPAEVTPTPAEPEPTEQPAPAPLPSDGLSLVIVGLIAAAILLIAFIALRLR